jgi:serine/threonine protein kinase
MPHEDAAENLAGRTLESGWTVIEKLEKAPGATGGFFSICYKVTKDGRVCFLKAFNFAKFFELATCHGQKRQVVDVISEMLDAYKYERDLSAMCRDRHVTKVAFVIDSGEETVEGFPITLVPYLIFDLADGDVRSKLTFSAKLESSWKLRSLHSVAVGLKQLHAIDVSHQDLKPSNVLLFQDESKIGDLGRSTCLAIDSRLNLRELPFAGQMSYAPPEILYGVHEPDWRTRSFACDCYLFGSLIVFYFSGVTMTALLRKHIPDDVSWERHRGGYDEVKAYVVNAFSKALDDFDCCIESTFLKSELRTMVEQLCHPLPDRRGHPKTLHVPGQQHDLERVVSWLDYLYRKVKYELGQ